MSNRTIAAIAGFASNRAVAAGWKPNRKRDEEAHYEFWAGAVSALYAAGLNDEAVHAERVTVLLVGTRGLSELPRLVNLNAEKAA